MADTSGYLVVGKIVGAHGVRGELKVASLSDNPERFQPGSDLLLDAAEGLISVKVAAVRPHKGMLLVRLVSINDRNAAELLRGGRLLIPESQAMTLGEDENFAHDLIGLKVETITGEMLGELTEILFTPANDVYVVVGPKGQWLLPALRDVILRVDLEARRIVVDVPDGLEAARSA
jgi:16S rRNA processing protein RimM